MNRNLISAICAFSGAGYGLPTSGQIVVANASQFDYGNLSTELTGYQSGLPSPDLEIMLDELFPSVEGGRNFQFRKLNDEDFITETDDSDERAEGADFKKVVFRGTTASDFLRNKGLTYVQDHDKLARTGDGRIIPGWENQIATRLRKRLIRAEILRGMAALRTASGSGTAKTWDAASNPDGDLRALVASSRDATGVRPTHLVIGDAAWQKRQDAYEAAGRANTGLANHAAYTDAELARYLSLAKVLHSEDVYQAKKGGTKAQLVVSEAIVYAAETGLGLDDPSSLKRVIGMCDSGSKWGVYVEAKPKFTMITVEHYSQFIVPQSAGVKRYTVS